MSQYVVQKCSSPIVSARAQLQDPHCRRIHISLQALFEALRWTIMGASSALHIWDPDKETFILRGLEDRQNGLVVITGYDEEVSARFVRLCLTSSWWTSQMNILQSHRQIHQDRDSCTSDRSSCQRSTEQVRYSLHPQAVNFFEHVRRAQSPVFHAFVHAISDYCSVEKYGPVSHADRQIWHKH